MFALFGSRVTLLQGSGQLLPREDPDVAGEVAELLQETWCRHTSELRCAEGPTRFRPAR
jgi:pyruvate/2-oxoglutarate dehydrogenase complex dihydrolipoamide dehydrogenase (E3) component